MKTYEWVLRSNQYEFDLKVSVSANYLEEAITKGRAFVDHTIQTKLGQCKKDLEAHKLISDPYVRQAMCGPVQNRILVIQAWANDLKGSAKRGRAWEMGITNPFIEVIPPLYE